VASGDPDAQSGFSNMSISYGADHLQMNLPEELKTSHAQLREANGANLSFKEL